MGYTTTFTGKVKVVPPLDANEIAYLNHFSRTRRLNRKLGPYFVGGSSDFGQGADPDVLDHNNPPKGQPGLWCQWVPTEDGKHLEWNGAEKFYNSEEWMEYLINHFLKPRAKALKLVPGLKGGHVVSGQIKAKGEERGDRWTLIVKNNKVSRTPKETR